MQQGQCPGNAMSSADIKLIEQKYGLKFNKNVFDCDTKFTVLDDLIVNGKLTIKFGHIKGYFGCANLKLTSLQGAPRSVYGDFGCFYNNLTSLQDAPSNVGGNFWCHNNPKKFTEQDVRHVCKVNGIIIC